MYKLLVTITCIVVLTIHWGEFSKKVNISKIFKITDNVINEVKE